MSGTRKKAAQPRRARAETAAPIDLAPALATAQAVGLLRAAVRTALSATIEILPSYEFASGRRMTDIRRALTDARSDAMEAERILAKHGLAGPTAETMGAVWEALPTTDKPERRS